MNELIMLVGIPASGKTTIAKEYEKNGYVWHSSYYDENAIDNSNDDDVLKLLYKSYLIENHMKFYQDFSSLGSFIEKIEYSHEIKDFQKRFKLDVLNDLFSINQVDVEAH